MNLAPYAATDQNSRGRAFDEPGPGYRSQFQRDRDRIIHSTAFRRLEYKTQVFINHEGDLFRTRLTHTIEVAQIARTLCRTLNLNEDLVEAIALAHDLGHTPFGHAGQDALDECMKPYGGFEHNLQSLRVIDFLETKYASFRGLNLTYETREGILKHCTKKKAQELGEVGERFFNGTHQGLEAQIANLADEIAYNNHDVDDGIRAGLLSLEQLRETSLFNHYYEEVLQKHPDANKRQIRHEIVRRMITHCVSDLMTTTRQNLEIANPRSIEDVRNASIAIASYSPELKKQNTELKRYLHKNLYKEHGVYRMMNKAKNVITKLFDAFLEDTYLLPPLHNQYAAEYEKTMGMDGRARAVADYIAGMTDRYAIDEYERVYDPRRVN